nr:hypothetical protein [Sporichthya sp.]
PAEPAAEPPADPPADTPAEEDGLTTSAVKQIAGIAKQTPQPPGGE